MSPGIPLPAIEDDWPPNIFVLVPPIKYQTCETARLHSSTPLPYAKTANAMHSYKDSRHMRIRYPPHNGHIFISSPILPSPSSQYRFNRSRYSFNFFIINFISCRQVESHSRNPPRLLRNLQHTSYRFPFHSAA